MGRELPIPLITLTPPTPSPSTAVWIPLSTDPFAISALPPSLAGTISVKSVGGITVCSVNGISRIVWRP